MSRKLMVRTRRGRESKGKLMMLTFPVQDRQRQDLRKLSSPANHKHQTTMESMESSKNQLEATAFS
jgi:hypothetical protein